MSPAPVRNKSVCLSVDIDALKLRVWLAMSRRSRSMSACVRFMLWFI
jgi:hypothetical protein